MAISKVSNTALLLLVVFLSRLGEFGHLSSCEDHVSTEGPAPLSGDFKTTVARSTKTPMRMMAQAAPDVNHAGEDELASEYQQRTVGSGFDEAKTAFENTKKRVGETYQTAKETMTESAKKEYEDAKEKALKAAGDLGAEIRKEKEEL